MGYNGKVGSVLPLLVLIDLTDIVVADDSSEDFRELDIGDVLAGARIASCTKLTRTKISFISVNLFRECVLPGSNICPRRRRPRPANDRG